MSMCESTYKHMLLRQSKSIIRTTSSYFNNTSVNLSLLILLPKTLFIQYSEAFIIYLFLFLLYLYNDLCISVQIIKITV